MLFRSLSITGTPIKLQGEVIESQTPAFEEKIITATVFPFPSQTVTPTVAQNATKMPTLPAIEAEKKVINLLQDNGGCKLPCFWGISSDQLSIQTIDSFFESFMKIGYQDISLNRNNSEIRISTNWDVKENSQIRYFKVLLGDYRKVDFGDGPYDEYIFDNSVFYEYTKYYNLSNMLSMYGQPEQVYVFVDPGRSMGFEDLYHIRLDYSKSGFVVQYTAEMTTQNGYFVGCPEKAFIYLKLWAPGYKSIESEKDSEIKEEGYHPLEEMTSLTLKDFFEIFKNPNNHSCLRTKMDFYKNY